MDRTACQAQVNACSTLYTCNPPVTLKSYERGAGLYVPYFYGKSNVISFWNLSQVITQLPAVVKGKEDHKTLTESLANVIQDVNKLMEDGGINVDG